MDKNTHTFVQLMFNANNFVQYYIMYVFRQHILIIVPSPTYDNKEKHHAWTVTHFNIIKKLFFPASYVRQLISFLQRQVLGYWKIQGEGKM